jgi:hypothetical protein
MRVRVDDPRIRDFHEQDTARSFTTARQSDVFVLSDRALVEGKSACCEDAAFQSVRRNLKVSGDGSPVVDPPFLRTSQFARHNKRRLGSITEHNFPVEFNSFHMTELVTGARALLHLFHGYLSSNQCAHRRVDSIEHAQELYSSHYDDDVTSRFI